MFQTQRLVSLVRFGEEENQNPELDFDAIQKLPAFQQAIERAVADRIDQEAGGIKRKNEELLGDIRKLKDANTALKQGVDDEQDLKDLASGKITHKDIYDRRVGANNKEWQERYGALEKEVEAVRKEKAETLLRLKRLHIESKLGDAASRNQFVQKSAYKDITSKGADYFDLDDNGNLVARDQHGNFVLNQKGQHITADEWIAGLEREYEHYFTPQQGSGARGGKAGAVKQMSAKEWTNAILSASPEEEKVLKAKKAAGEISIEY